MRTDLPRVDRTDTCFSCQAGESTRLHTARERNGVKWGAGRMADRLLLCDFHHLKREGTWGMTHLEDLLHTWDSGLTERTVFDSVTTILMTSSSPSVREGGGKDKPGFPEGFWGDWLPARSAEDCWHLPVGFPQVILIGWERIMDWSGVSLNCYEDDFFIPQLQSNRYILLTLMNI